MYNGTIFACSFIVVLYFCSFLFFGLLIESHKIHSVTIRDLM